MCADFYDSPLVYVIILNWNGWRDTIECLESVFKSDYPNYRVIVCDNGSDDNSLEYIKSWADGRLDIAIPADNPLRCLSFPPVPKSIPYIWHEGTRLQDDSKLILIQSEANLGYAGGNNIGICYVQESEFDYIWLLNNDTVVKPDALSRLVERMLDSPEAGLCGTTILYYHKPDRIQVLGGSTYNMWLASGKHIGMNRRFEIPIDAEQIEKKLAYITGASVLVSSRFLHDIGLMSEDYFLYYEELDWALRARGRYKLAYAPQSIVYHKEGGSMGWNGREEKSPISDYYLNRNRILVTRKFCPDALPMAYLRLVGSFINRVRKLQWSRLGIYASILTGNGPKAGR